MGYPSCLDCTSTATATRLGRGKSASITRLTSSSTLFPNATFVHNQKAPPGGLTGQYDRTAETDLSSTSLLPRVLLDPVVPAIPCLGLKPHKTKMMLDG